MIGAMIAGCAQFVGHQEQLIINGKDANVNFVL
jgi:hypothetical protein